jgi:hypothetical protein
LDIPFVLDWNKEFFNANKDIFDNAEYRTFVSDSHGKIIFTGLPIANGQKWNKFIKTVKQ